MTGRVRFRTRDLTRIPAPILQPFGSSMSTPPVTSRDIRVEGGLSRISALQWRSGIAAWLGWTFDGLDMHLYTLVAAPFVAELIAAGSTTNPLVGRYSSIIQGAFLLGWAVGGDSSGGLAIGSAGPGHWA